MELQIYGILYVILWNIPIIRSLRCIECFSWRLYRGTPFALIENESGVNADCETSPQTVLQSLTTPMIPSYVSSTPFPQVQLPSVEIPNCTMCGTLDYGYTYRYKTDTGHWETEKQIIFARACLRDNDVETFGWIGCSNLNSTALSQDSDRTQKEIIELDLRKSRYSQATVTSVNTTICNCNSSDLCNDQVLDIDKYFANNPIDPRDNAVAMEITFNFIIINVAIATGTIML